MSPDDIELERLLTQLLRAIAPDFRAAAAQNHPSAGVDAAAEPGADAAGKPGADAVGEPGADAARALDTGAAGEPGADVVGEPGADATGGADADVPGDTGAVAPADPPDPVQVPPQPAADANGLPQVTGSEARALIELVTARGIAQGELAGLLGLEKSTVSRLAAGLERKGWLQRGRDEGNQRYRRLYLTPQGAGVAAGVWQAWQLRQARILGSLSADERAGLSAGLRGLVRGLAAEGLLGDASADDDPSQP